MEFISHHARGAPEPVPLQTMTPSQLHADSVAQPGITHRNKIIEKRYEEIQSQEANDVTGPLNRVERNESV